MPTAQVIQFIEKVYYPQRLIFESVNGIQTSEKFKWLVFQLTRISAQPCVLPSKMGFLKFFYALKNLIYLMVYHSAIYIWWLHFAKQRSILEIVLMSKSIYNEIFSYTKLMFAHIFVCSRVKGCPIWKIKNMFSTTMRTIYIQCL